MPYTLISFVGKGQFSESEAARRFASGYLPANYKFPQLSAPIKHHIFAEALLMSHLYDIRQIFFFGTRTSDWAMFFYEWAQQDKDMESLWFLADEEIHSENGITDKTLKRIEALLTRKYSVPVILKVHRDRIDSDTIESIFRVYSAFSNDILENSDILFDITHGFRSMPLLAYQALIHSAPDMLYRKVKIIYAELRRANERNGEDPQNPPESPVRNLEKYWDLTESAHALRLFQNNLDGEDLARLIRNQWSDGAIILEQLSYIVKFNLALCIKQFRVDVRRTLDAFDENCAVQNDFTLCIKKELELICSRLSGVNYSDILVKYSCLLKERACFAQAVIALWVAVQTRVIETIDPSKIGNYNFWQDTGKSRYRNLLRLKNFQDDYLLNLEHFRNSIAHGGADSQTTGGFPNTEHLKYLLKDSEKRVRAFFREVPVGDLNRR